MAAITGVRFLRLALGLYAPLFILGWVMGQVGFARASFVDTTTSTGNVLTVTLCPPASSSPHVCSVSPADTATGVPINATIVISFNEAMNAASVQSAFSASPAITCTWSWNGPTNTIATCTPSANLIAETLYTLTIGTGAQDAAGTAMPFARQFTFTTFGTTGAPSVVAVSPYPGATSVGTNSNVAITFSEMMNLTSAQNAFSLRQTSGSGSPCYVIGSTPLCSTNGGSFSWNPNNTMSFDPTNTLVANASYTVVVATSAQNAAGATLGNAFSSTFTAGAGADASTPQVVPPTIPGAGTTGISRDTSISVTFSEGMDNVATADAFSLRICLDNSSSCTSPGTVEGGSFTWGGAGNNNLIFNPTSNLASNQWYKGTITTGAKDLAGNAMAAAYSFVFQTAAASSSAPNAPTVTSPVATVWTSAATHSASGSADADALVEIWTDGGTRGAIDGTDTVVASLQLEGGLTSWSISVPLVSGAANLFQVTARSSAGVRSSPTLVPMINQGDNTTTTGSLTLLPGSENITVRAAFSGDANANNSATVRWRQTGGFYGSSVAMTRNSGYFSYVITALNNSTSYDVQVTFGDSNGITGTNPTTATTTTLTGTRSGLITSTSSSLTFSSRAPQSTTLSAVVSGSVTRVQFTVNTSPAKTSACLTPSGGSASFTWDGTDGSSNPVADATYTYTVRAWRIISSCDVSQTNQMEERGGLAILSNAGSLDLSPEPATVFLTPGQSVAVTTTAWNRRDELVPDGASVSWSATGSVSGSMNSSLSRTSSVIGTTYAGECSVTVNTGQACTKLTIPSGSKISQMITITATMNTQLVGTTLTTVSGSTTVLDPPLPPDQLELSVGSVRARWQPARDAGVAGYGIYIGTEPGTYSVFVDVGQATAFTYPNVVPGTRYYVKVRSYNRDGTFGPGTAEASLLIPISSATATPATPTAVAATATRTPVPSATVIASSVTPTSAATSGPPIATPTRTAVPTIPATATAPPTATPQPTVAAPSPTPRP
jgi:Bacterial Ig-like domain